MKDSWKMLERLSKIAGVACIGLLITSTIITIKYGKLLLSNGDTDNSSEVTQEETVKKDKSSCVYYSNVISEDNLDKEINVVGFMAGALSDDGKSAWLMERPFLSSEEVKNRSYNPVEIQSKIGEKFEYNMYAVEVTGTLKKDTNGDYCIVDATCETYKPYDKGYLDQYNTLITLGYVEEMDHVLAALYEKLNYDDYEDYDTSKLRSIDEELRKSYKKYEFMEQAEYLASNLLALYQSITPETNKEDANTEAQKLYDDFYAHLMQFDLSNLYEIEYGDNNTSYTGEIDNSIDDSNN